MNKPTKTRIAVYIRIGGTGNHESAFETQKTHFTDMISKNPDWELAGFYADLGTDSRNQPNLQRLMADCRAERIDLIITKSTSRISRSLGVLMKFVRELAYLKPPVGVYFEDTKLNTLERDSFLLLTMCEAIAISESETKNETMPYIQLTRHMKIQEKFRKKKKSGEESNGE